MASTSDRLIFTAGYTSQSKVAVQLGVSQSTVSRWVRGIHPVNPEYNKEIGKLYQRTAYDTLRTAGSPAGSARRFSLKNPDTVINTLMDLDIMTVAFTEHRIAYYIRSIGETVNQKNIEKYWGQALEETYQSLRDSAKPLERILDYFRNR